ncbi:MAG: DNA alkylation repair protein [Clostridiales bacterium]|nr:DNA alkylation repair protein [Clostridiales bacterium]
MDIKAKLHALSDAGYAAFQRRLIPNIPPETIIGVRTPELRKLAKEMIKSGEADGFIASLPHDSFEENQLHAFIINACRDFGECVADIDRFLPHVDNWATCDALLPRVFAKHRRELISHIEKWLRSEHEYTLRFGIGMLMKHCLGEDYRPNYPEMVAEIRSDAYYVNMMRAWYFAEALTLRYDEILPCIEEGRLDRWTHNMAIRKSCESFRVPPEHKAYLRELRR